MTNKDKFLIDGVSAEEFSQKLGNYIKNREKNEPILLINDFLNMKVQPTLTEDERVILRNIDPRECNVIGRDKNTEELYLAYLKTTEKEDREYMFDVIFPNLFQFIKERRRIFY